MLVYGLRKEKKKNRESGLFKNNNFRILRDLKRIVYFTINRASSCYSYKIQTKSSKKITEQFFVKIVFLNPSRKKA
jgi:hypothetical protein